MKVNILTQYSTLLPGSNTAWEETDEIVEYDLQDVPDYNAPVVSFVSESVVDYGGGCKKKTIVDNRFRVYNDYAYEPVHAWADNSASDDNYGLMGFVEFVKHVEARHSCELNGYQTRECVVDRITSYLTDFIVINGTIFRQFGKRTDYEMSTKE